MSNADEIVSAIDFSSSCSNASLGLEKLRSCTLFIGTKCTWACGTSKPITAIPILEQSILASIAFDTFFENLVDDLIKSSKIKISSFGTFEVINKKKRIGRNPKTKVEALISARKVVKFKASQLLKKKLNK